MIQGSPPTIQRANVLTFQRANASAPADQPAGGVFNLERWTQNESRGVKPVLDSGNSKQCIRRALTSWRAALVSHTWPVDSGQVPPAVSIGDDPNCRDTGRR